MLSRWMRTWYGKVLSPLVWVLRKSGATPDMLTGAGLLAHVAAGILFALNQLGSGLAALLLGQLLDTFDGELARTSAAVSPYGAFLDSICDHVGDFAVYLGLLWHYLGMNSHTEVFLIAVALFGSVFGSQVRSRAGMVGIDTKAIGAFTRFERSLVIAAGIVLNHLTVALWVLAIFNNVSALQRTAYVVRAARRKPAVIQN